MRVGIVGAGIAGLAAARTLKHSGIEAVVFEKSAAYGGRCTTRKLGAYVFDPGATSIAPRNTALATTMLNELPTDDLIKIEMPIYTHRGLRIEAGDPVMNRLDRYTYASGNAKLAQLLSDGLDIRFETQVESIEKGSEGGYRLLAEEFTHLILTAPAPRTSELLASIGEFRPIGNIRYRSCLSVMLGYKLPAPATRCHAVIDPDQRHPITWLSLESVKSPHRAPDGCTAVVVQMGPAFSQMNFDHTEAAIIAATVVHLERLYGKGWGEPDLADVKRWRFSQPEMTASFESVNHPKATILVSGDGVMGARVEYAYASGVAAAERLAAQR